MPGGLPGWKQRGSRAREVYQNGGISSLTFQTSQFIRRGLTDLIVQEVLFPDYERHVIGTDALRNRCSDEQLWELKQGKTLTVEEQSDVAPLRERDDLQYWTKPINPFVDPFVAELRDVYLVGRYPLSITSDGKVVGDTIYFGSDNPCESFRWRYYQRMTSAVQESSGRTWVSIKTGSSRFKAPTVPYATTICEPSDNFYHWMIDNLTKLRGVERFEEETGNEVTLILRADAPSFVHEALDALGYGENSYLEWEGGPLHVDRLVVPSFPEPDLETLEWLRSRLEASKGEKKVDSRGVYISRQKATKGRRIRNYDEVTSMLSDYGVEPIYLEDLSLSDEVATLQHADWVVGPHGAGLTSMIWTDDLYVVELFNTVVNAPFYILAEILGHNYGAIAGQGVGKTGYSRDQDIVIDVDELEHELATRIPI